MAVTKVQCYCTACDDKSILDHVFLNHSAESMVYMHFVVELDLLMKNGNAFVNTVAYSAVWGFSPDSYVMIA